MSQANLEVVRTAMEALLRGDVGEALALFDDDAEWHNTSEFPGPRVCHGPREIEAFWTALFEEFNRAGMELEHSADCGDAIVVGMHSWGTGRASGAPIDVRWASVYRLREGKIIRVDIYGDYERALGAARG